MTLSRPPSVLTSPDLYAHNGDHVDVISVDHNEKQRAVKNEAASAKLINNLIKFQFLFS